MRNKIQQALDPIKAEAMLKSDTKAYLSHKLYRPTKKPTPTWRFATVMACFVMLLFGGGYYAYFTPVSAISIDINPSIELSINRFDRVVSVVGYNEDGKALVPLLSVRNLPYEQAIEAILAQEQMQRYLAEGELLSMTVAGNSQKQNDQMLTALSQYTTQDNIFCHAANSQAVAGAHGNGLSIGKYSAYLALYELDPSVTVEEVKYLTMRQIRDKITALSGENSLPQGNGNRSGLGGGQGGNHGGNAGNGHRGGRK